MHRHWQTNVCHTGPTDDPANLHNIAKIHNEYHHVHYWDNSLPGRFSKKSPLFSFRDQVPSLAKFSFQNPAIVLQYKRGNTSLEFLYVNNKRTIYNLFIYILQRGKALHKNCILSITKS